MPTTSIQNPLRVKEAQMTFDLFLQGNAERTLKPITGSETPKELFERVGLKTSDVARAIPCADSTLRNAVSGLSPLNLSPYLLIRLALLLAVPVEVMVRVFDAQRVANERCGEDEKVLIEQCLECVPALDPSPQQATPERPVLTLDQIRRSSDGSKITSTSKFLNVRFTSDTLGATFYAADLLTLDWARLHVLHQEASLVLTARRLKLEGIDAQLADESLSFDERCKLRDMRDRADAERLWARRFYGAVGRAIELLTPYYKALQDVRPA